MQNWVKSVAATGTFIKDENTTWPTGLNGIPTGWTVYNDGDEPEPPVIEYDVWTVGGQEVDPPYSLNGEDGHSSAYAKGNFDFTLNVML